MMNLNDEPRIAGWREIRAKAYAQGEDLGDEQLDDLRSNLPPERWLEICRQRETAIENRGAPPALKPQQGPLPEATIVRLRAGGPLMTVEDIRPSDSLVQCVWIDARGRARRGAFHHKALVEASSPLMSAESEP